MASLIKRMLAEGLGCDVTKRIVRTDGDVRHIRCVGAAVVENGTLKSIVGSAIDVTEHEILTQERAGQLGFTLTTSIEHWLTCGRD